MTTNFLITFCFVLQDVIQFFGPTLLIACLPTDSSSVDKMWTSQRRKIYPMTSDQESSVISEPGFTVVSWPIFLTREGMRFQMQI